MGKIAAFFDIDGTLYRDSLMVEHFKKLIKYDIIILVTTTPPLYISTFKGGVL